MALSIMLARIFIFVVEIIVKLNLLNERTNASGSKLFCDMSIIVRIPHTTTDKFKVSRFSLQIPHCQ